MKVLREIYNRIEERMDYGEEEWTEFRSGLNEVENKLLDLVAQQTNDETAAQELFQSGKSFPAFRKKKLSLRKKLLNEIIKYQPNRSSSPDIRLAYHETLKLSHQLGILQSWAAHISSKEVALQLYKKAVFYDFTDKVIEASRALLNNYRLAEPNAKLRKYYYEGCKEYSVILDKEILASWYESIVSGYFQNNKTIKTAVFKIATEYEKELSKHELKFSSFRFFFNFYIIKVVKYLAIADYESALPVAREAYDYFSLLRYEHRACKVSFLRYIAAI